MNGFKILGTGSYVPENTLDNFQLSRMVDTNDEWITTRTGIQSRHITVDQNTSQLASEAARRAIENSGIRPEEIGVILVATFTPDCYTPSVACMVQQQLGLQNIPLAAFDLNAACSGFVYGLTVAGGLLATMPNKAALVIGAEVISKVLDYTDRVTCILFGDGAGAVVLRHDERAPFYSILRARGDDRIIRAPSVDLHDRQKPQLLRMNGKEVYQFAVETETSCIEEILEKAGCTLDSVKTVICHQANARIISSIAKKLNARPEQFIIRLSHTGNTSAASIPMVLDDMNRNGQLQRGDRLILTGFGGGLTWGAAYLEW